MTTVELREITKKFGGVTALYAVNMRIEPGEFFTLLGPSGSGKSTLLRILAGLEAPSSGQLCFDGADVTRIPPWRRQTAMVFQNYALYPHMTVAQNIGYPLRLQKTPKAEAAARVREVAEALQIGHLLERKPTQISGGQQQRVALARALARKPKLFLFDEPLSNLDARMRLDARTFIKTLQRDMGITAIYVTHDQSEAMALSDRMAILEHGHLRQVGTPRDVYRDPATAFVGTFVGSPPMNLLRVSVGEDGARLDGPGADPLPLGRNGVPLGPALLGVRPEDILWSEQGVPATVVLSEDFGHEILVTVEVGGQRIVMRRTGAPPPAGTKGAVTFNADRVRWFPAEPS